MFWNQKPNIVQQSIGYKSNNDKCLLPYHMGSMDKIKDITKIKQWFLKHNSPTFIVSSKLDGSSAMLEQKNGRIRRDTRGNGTIGRDISHLIPLMKKYGKLPNINDNYCVRGELIVNKTILNTIQINLLIQEVW